MLYSEIVRGFEPLDEILKHKHTDALFWISVYLKLPYYFILHCFQLFKWSQWNLKPYCILAPGVEKRNWSKYWVEQCFSSVNLSAVWILNKHQFNRSVRIQLFLFAPRHYGRFAGSSWRKVPSGKEQGETPQYSRANQIGPFCFPGNLLKRIDDRTNSKRLKLERGIESWYSVNLMR